MRAVWVFLAILVPMGRMQSLWWRDLRGDSVTDQVHLGRLTRTEAICRAILEELRRRRQVIDENPQLASVSLEIFLQDGPEMVRSVSYGEHVRVARRRA